MFGAIASFVGSAAFGGLTGLFGGLINRAADYFTFKQKCTFDLAMRDKDLAIAQVEATKELAIAKDVNYTARENAEEETMQRSYEVDKATYITPELEKDLPPWARGLVAAAMAIVDFIRGLTRPGITLYMCVLTTMIYVEMQQIVSASKTPAFTSSDAVKIIILIVDGVLYLTTMSVGWWFATRAKASGEK